MSSVDISREGMAPRWFLRRVLEARLLEQYGSPDQPFRAEDELRERWLDEVTRTQLCRLCRRRVRQLDQDDGSKPARAVCTPCGGRRKQRALERQEGTRAP